MYSQSYVFLLSFLSPCIIVLWYFISNMHVTIQYLKTNKLFLSLQSLIQPYVAIALSWQSSHFHIIDRKIKALTPPAGATLATGQGIMQWDQRGNARLTAGRLRHLDSASASVGCTCCYYFAHWSFFSHPLSKHDTGVPDALLHMTYVTRCCQLVMV